MISIDDVVKAEWEQFQQVNNRGGRASCQDNWGEFYIMRKSQFLAWNDEMVTSYYRDLMHAKEQGENLLFEKYAFMMKYTAPEEFKKLKPYLPVPSERKQQLIKDIVKVQVKWAEEFEKRYPAYASRGRMVHTSDEHHMGTSMETYLIGELLSYGEGTIELYAAYVKECVEQGRNMAVEVREHMAKLSGYKSIEDVEEHFKRT